MPLYKRPQLLDEHEAKWNDRARVFVETFQRIMKVGNRPDSLAGFRTFEALKALDTEGRVTAEEWELIRKLL